MSTKAEMAARVAARHAEAAGSLKPASVFLAMTTKALGGGPADNLDRVWARLAPMDERLHALPYGSAAAKDLKQSREVVARASDALRKQVEKAAARDFAKVFGGELKLRGAAIVELGSGWEKHSVLFSVFRRAGGEHYIQVGGLGVEGEVLSALKAAGYVVRDESRLR